MSIDGTIIFSPVIFCENVKIAREIYTCVKEGCGKAYKRFAKDGNFCNICGSPLENALSKKLTCSKINTWAISEKINEVLMNYNRDSIPDIPDNVDVWFSNKTNDGFYSFDIHESFDIDPSKIDYQKEIIRFKELYADEIRVLEGAYGKDNVKIRWIFTTRWS